MSKKKCDIEFGECVYCGKVRPITDDHIPPKNLYAKPRPSNLLTVPSCYPCNNEASKDDEYFRRNIVLREDTPNLPEAKGVYESVLRSLTRQEATGFKRDLLQRMRDFEHVTPGGLYTGKVHGYIVDLSRLDRVASRIIKGLFYIDRGERLPDEYEVTVFSASGLTNVRQGTQLQIKGIVDTLLKSPCCAVGKKEVFSYWSLPEEGSLYSSAWLLVFFQKTAFIGFITPRRTRNAA